MRQSDRENLLTTLLSPYLVITRHLRLHREEPSYF